MGLHGIPEPTLTKSVSGSAHGRFQVLHNGHIEYLLAAKARCEFLYVGITQYDLGNLSSSPVDQHRELPANNPLSYFERMQVITEALVDEGLSPSEFSVIPFPIDTPEKLSLFLPSEVPVFTTVYDKWNKHKISVLQALGYEVIVLWERTEKLYDGVKIRYQIRRRDPAWQDQVPMATIRSVERYHLVDRLIRLTEKEDGVGDNGS